MSNKKIYNLFVGRWQPFHEGHEKLIRKVLDEGKNVLVAIRDTEISDKNPFTVEERADRIATHFVEEMASEQLKITTIPDIEAVCFGRQVGYEIREIHLDQETEAISGTKTREEMRANGEL